jgi:hypothetical protein
LDAGRKTGNYQIKIAGPRPFEPTHRYGFKLEAIAELSTAPSLDQRNVKAHRVFWEGSVLVDQRGEQRSVKPLKSIRKLSLMASTWRPPRRGLKRFSNSDTFMGN